MNGCRGNERKLINVTFDLETIREENWFVCTETSETAVRHHKDKL